MTDQNLPAPGDPIPVFWKTRVTLETVRRTTTMQLVTESGRKFRLDSGMEIGQSADRFHGTPRAVTPSNPSYAEKLAEARVQHADAVAAQACSEWERRHRRDPECIRAATGALTALADRMGEATQQH